MENKQKSKEVQAIEDSLNAYIEKHNGECVINVCICAFDSESDVIDDQIWLHGESGLLLINNEGMERKIKNRIAE
jgi:hypothetical protein